MKTKFQDFIKENDGGGVAMATMGNTGGMGNVVAPQPSSVPGDVAGSTMGSGDMANNTFKPVFKSNMIKKGKKKRKKL